MTRDRYKLKRENAELKAQLKAIESKCAPAEAQAPAKIEEVSADQKQPVTSKKTGRCSGFVEKWKGPVGLFVAIVGVMASIFSFFPHVTISEPVQMDATDLFSYKITVSNDGLLPIFGVKWAFAPRYIKMAAGSANDRAAKLILPHRADWVITTNLMKSVTQPGTTRHAAIMIGPGSEMIVDGQAGYAFHLRLADNYIGTVSPGDQFTFTTEGLMSAPPQATYDTADFAIAISYVPVFPVVRMQTCSHFHIYKDRQGTPHWFRETNHCERFPWMHGWFQKAPTRPRSQ